MAGLTSLFDYEDYKAYVRDWVEGRPSGGRGLYKQMAEHLSLSHVMISQIFSADRQISPEHAFRLAGFLGLTETQRDYFLALVSYARAGSADYEAYWKRQIERLRQNSKDLKTRMPQDRELSEIEKARFYSHWTYSAIRLATSLDDLKTAQGLAERFDLPLEKVHGIIEFLVKHDLVRETPEGYAMGVQRLHLESTSPFIQSRQLGWRFKAIQQMNFKQADDLYYTGPMSVSRQAQKDIRESLMKLFEEISGRVTREPPETLVCLNVDLFEF